MIIEQDYIDATDLTKLRFILHMMRGITPDNQPIIDSDKFNSAQQLIYESILKLEAKVDTTESGLLKKYVHHVMECESVSFVGDIGNTEQSFTEVEVEILKGIDKDYD